ncbi:hypothetical protein ACFUEN_29180 [Streptomyces griseorubiginosus]|uniref:hypothetical protein n=1 Tax=Streptomyces griseorubiginosus TaxID=67304 RepID=UPI00362D3FAC
MTPPDLNPADAAKVHYTDPRVRALAFARWHLTTGGTHDEWLWLGKDNPAALIQDARDWLRAVVALGLLPLINPSTGEPLTSSEQPPLDRAAVLREAAAAIEEEQAREEATEWAQQDELDPETEVGGAAVRAMAGMLRRRAAEAEASASRPAPPPAARATVYREVADRLAADASQGAQEGWMRIYKRGAASKVREWADEMDLDVSQPESRPEAEEQVEGGTRAP